VRSQQAKEAAAKHPGLELEKKVGQYEIYRVKDNDGRYALPLAVAPALVVTSHWKEAAYRWFKRARPGDPLPVFAESASEGRSARSRWSTRRCRARSRASRSPSRPRSTKRWEPTGSP